MPWIRLSELLKVMDKSEKVEITRRFQQGMSLKEQPKPEKVKPPKKKLEFSRY